MKFHLFYQAIFSIFFRIFQIGLRITFGCKRRFCGCDKGIAQQFQQPQKCGVVKRHQGRQPDWGFTEPMPPSGGAVFTILLSAGFLLC